MYMELVKGLLHSIGVKALTHPLSELFRLVEQYCHWFQYQTVIVKFEGMENNSKGIEKATSEG